MSDALIYVGDCIAEMSKLSRESVEVVITSPPYNLDVGYNSYNDGVSREDYLAWTLGWIREVEKVLARDGSFFLNMGGKPTDPWGPYQVINAIKGIFELQNVIHWIKSISIDEVGSFGHYKPINSQRFLNDTHEFVFHLTKTGDVLLDRLALGVEYVDKANVSRWETNIDLRCRGNVWFIPYSTRKTKLAHPTTFPVDLPKWCIKLHGVERAKTVLDPFVGSGTTAIAALDLGCNFIGYEIDEVYATAARKRIEDHRRG